MRQSICLGIFLILEISMNIISLIIIPKPYDFSFLSKELKSPKIHQLQF